MCSCHSIPECRVMFSGVKLSIGSFILLPKSSTVCLLLYFVVLADFETFVVDPPCRKGSGFIVFGFCMTVHLLLKMNKHLPSSPVIMILQYHSVLFCVKPRRLSWFC